MGTRRKKQSTYSWTFRVLVFAGVSGSLLFALLKYYPRAFGRPSAQPAPGARIQRSAAELRGRGSQAVVALAKAAWAEDEANDAKRLAAPAKLRPASKERPAAPALAKVRAVKPWVIIIDCEEGKGVSCDDACEDQGMTCDPEAMQPLTNWEKVNAAFAAAGATCHSRVEIDVAGRWDGPHLNGQECAYSTNSLWEPSCDLRPNCGWNRLCACKSTGNQAPGPMRFKTIAERPMQWYDIASHVSDPIRGDWDSETQFLDELLRSFGKLRADYRGPSRLRGFKYGQLFDDNGMFAFADTIASVAIDVGAANNPLEFDINNDDSQVSIFIEPLQWKTIEDDWLRQATAYQEQQGGCAAKWSPICSLERAIVFPAAVSSELGKATFHATANPYCGSLEGFTDDEDKSSVDSSLKDHPDPEVRGIFKACYQDASLREGASERKVPTVSLKSIIERIPKRIRLKYMKIDAQGHDFKVFLSAGNQVERIEYVRFEMQVDPPPGRKMVKDIPSYAAVEDKMRELGFAVDPGDNHCHFDAGASTFSKEIKEMECVFCKQKPCREVGVPPLGPHPAQTNAETVALPYQQPLPWQPRSKTGLAAESQHSRSEIADTSSSNEPAGAAEAPSVHEASSSKTADSSSRNEQAGVDSQNSESMDQAPALTADSPREVYKPPEAMPQVSNWNGLAEHIPLPTEGDWMSESQFLERVLRSFGKQRLGYKGFQRMDGFQEGKIFDDNGMFAFDKTIRSVAIDVGAATNPLSFDLHSDVTQVAFFVEPLQWKTLEHAVEVDSVALHNRGGCITRWDGFCAMDRFYTFAAAVSNKLGHSPFHATANPYCGSLEAFTADTDKSAIENSLKNSDDPEIRGIFEACYKDAGTPGTVPTISLKAILDRIPKKIRIKYIKIDAQGHDFKVLLSAGDQMSRLEYVRFEMQVDPPPGRKLVHDIPSYEEVKKQLAGLGFKHEGRHACHFDHGASPFSKAVKEMECVFCRKPPCQESGRPPLGENPNVAAARRKKAMAKQEAGH